MNTSYNATPEGVAASRKLTADGICLTTAQGVPIATLEARNSLTVGASGPVLISDSTLIEKLATFNRERVPERVVHALGAGAHGYFEANGAMLNFSKAKVFHLGTRTATFVRFSSVAAERGGDTLQRDPRGFAIKFYTEDGIWDLVANNIPVFWIRDPMLFPDLIHSQKRDPASDVPSADSFYDFLAATPESIHAFLHVFADRGIPASFRNMNGYSGHSFRVVNEAGSAYYVRFHLKAKDGVKSLSSEAAAGLRGQNPDFLKTELHHHLTAGGTAAWTMYVQAIPEEDADQCEVDIFDVTKVIPHSLAPLVEIGSLVLNEPVGNVFAETESVAFSPGNLVPGIEASQDRMLQGRIFAYADAQRYRLGSSNFTQLQVNAPLRAPANHYRDGVMNATNPGGTPAYHTGLQSTGGPQCTAAANVETGAAIAAGKVGRYDQAKNAASCHRIDDFAQPAAFYAHVLTADERARLERNIAGHLGGAKQPIQERFLALLAKVDGRLSERVADGLKQRIPSASGKTPSLTTPALTIVSVKTGTQLLDVLQQRSEEPRPKIAPLPQSPTQESSLRSELKGLEISGAAGQATGET